MNCSQSICGTETTIDIVEKCILSKIPTQSKIASFEAVDIGDGKGYFSVLAKVSLTWKPEDSNLPKTVIVKIPTTGKLDALKKANPSMDAMADRMISNLHKIHNCEVAAYKLFSETSVAPLPLPVIYGVSKMLVDENKKLTQPAYIIMEDLGTCAGVDYLRMHVCTDQQKEQIYRSVGKLHAWSLRNEELTRKIIEPVDIVNIMFADPDALKLKPFVDTLKTAPWVDVWPPELSAAIPDLEISHEDAKQMTTLNRKYGIPDVMSHGDLHTLNMMFADDGKGELHSVIDWQCVFFGSPCNDLTRVMTMGSGDSQYQTAHGRKAALQIYYKSFVFAIFSYTIMSLPFLTQVEKDSLQMKFIKAAKLLAEDLIVECEKLKN